MTDAVATKPVPRVLGLFPHPDDESYAAGAFLAQCAQAGLDVRVVCATRGEAGSDRRAPRTPAELARVRSAEVRDACAALGVRLDGFLELPDGRLAEIGDARLDLAIEPFLAAFRPHVVITLGEDGVYGSLDHIALTRRIDTVARRFAIAVLHAQFPQGHFAPLRRRLQRAGMYLDGRIPLGRKVNEVALRVDATRQRTRKLAAVCAHASQLRDGDPWSFLGGRLLEPLLQEEWFTPA